MRILQIAAPARFGGLESVLLELSKGLARNGHQVSIVAVLDQDATNHPVTQQASESGITVVELAVAPRAYYHEFHQLVMAIKRFTPDLVHTHGYRADLIGGFAARRSAVPWVATAHGFTGGGRKNRLYEWLQARAYRQADAVLAVSSPLKARLTAQGVSSSRVHVVPNATAARTPRSRQEVRQQLGIDTDALVVGWVGRLTHEKGADVFLEALALQPAAPWRASIIGAGRDQEELRGLAKRLGISDRVRWHGALPEAATLFPAFDAWVLSSRTEGTPIVLLEAMAACVPIVTTAVGGIPDVVSPAEAILVPPERPDRLANALAELLRNPAEAVKRADAAARRLIGHFGTGAWVEAHERIYASLCPPT